MLKKVVESPKRKVDDDDVKICPSPKHCKTCQDGAITGNKISEIIDSLVTKHTKKGRFISTYPLK